MKEFRLDIVTPDGLKLSDTVESLLLRTTEGECELLAGHVDFIASVGTGRARIRKDGGDTLASISRGIITVKGGEVTLAAVTFEFADDIDVARAKRAKAEAEERIKNAKDDRALALAEAKLERAIARISVAQMK